MKHSLLMLLTFWGCTTLSAWAEKQIFVSPKGNDRAAGTFSKHSVNHVFLSPTSIINFTSKKQSYDDTRRSSRDNELLQRAQSDL